MEKKKSLNKGDIWYSMAVCGFMFSLIGGAVFYHSNKTEKLHSNVEELADTNKDGMTDHDEWHKVYQTVRKHYNVNNPEELSREDMNKYIKSKDLESKTDE